MRIRAYSAVAGLLALAGCAELGKELNAFTTAGLAAVVGSATGSPVLGLIAGTAASYGIGSGIRYADRLIAGSVQNAVAVAAGGLGVGQAAPWQVEEDLPLSGRTGTVQVARTFGEAIPCKDIVFTIDDSPDFFATTICQRKDGVWRWALAEPTVQRWGSLQ
ncbi:MAG TPA: hypothetical protein VD978_12905 [Azospirillum sp.]|nr:hypothetical protein [Azospirillum sp.]